MLLATPKTRATRCDVMWCDEMRKDEVDWGSLWVGLTLMQGCWLPVSFACLIIYLIIVVVDGDEEELSATVTGTVGQLTAMAAEIRDQTRVAVAVAAVSIRLFSLSLWGTSSGRYTQSPTWGVISYFFLHLENCNWCSSSGGADKIRDCAKCR